MFSTFFKPLFQTCSHVFGTLGLQKNGRQSVQGGTLALYNASICTDNPLIQFLEVVAGNAYEQLVDPTQCQWASGYKMNISSVVFYFVASLTTLCTSPPGFFDGDDDKADRREGGEVDGRDDGNDEESA